jgi:hypothetical protein
MQIVSNASSGDYARVEGSWVIGLGLRYPNLNFEVWILCPLIL